jgi:hypothetical protein
MLLKRLARVILAGIGGYAALTVIGPQRADAQLGCSLNCVPIHIGPPCNCDAWTCVPPGGDSSFCQISNNGKTCSLPHNCITS